MTISIKIQSMDELKTLVFGGGWAGGKEGELVDLTFLELRNTGPPQKTAAPEQI